MASVSRRPCTTWRALPSRAVDACLWSTLTRKETGILEDLMVHQGRPVSQEELMEHVWDNSVDSFSNSIRVHISALRKKLRAVLGYDPIRNRIGEGYLMGGEEE